MAVSFASDMRRGGDTFTDFPQNIRIAPDLNGRQDHTSVEGLAADIELNGQHTPVIIRKDDEGHPVLVAGHRRWRAITLLNSRCDTQRKIVCTFRSGMSEVDAMRLAISENRFRKDVSPVDDAANITLLRTRFALSDEDIAAVYFPENPGAKDSIRFVKQRGSLSELSPEAAQAVREGKVKITAAVALAKLSKSQQRDKVKNSEGKLTATDAGARKQTSIKSVRLAAAAIFAALDETQERFVEVHRDHIEALKEALSA